MPNISLEDFADQMTKVIPELAKEFMRQESCELYKGKITLPQFLILDLLNNSGESIMKSLAQNMKVTTAAMTGMVERLVRDGYVARVYEAQDRRIIKVKATARGVALANKINEQRHNTIVKIFGRISDNDRQDYLRILLQIKKVLQQDTNLNV